MRLCPIDLEKVNFNPKTALAWENRVIFGMKKSRSKKRLSSSLHSLMIRKDGTLSVFSYHWTVLLCVSVLLRKPKKTSKMAFFPKLIQKRNFLTEIRLIFAFKICVEEKRLRSVNSECFYLKVFKNWFL